MAIYHLSVKAVSRSAGRSSTAAAAYRAGCEITDRRTGEVHDYTRKRGVESADMVLPDGAPKWATDRAALWNAAEAAERRKDACVAREFEVALPSELSPEERRRLAVDFAKEMANAEGCAVDVAIHAPGKDGDNRNHHAHILRTTRKVGPEGLTDKLDTEKSGRKRGDDLAAVRERWAELVNERLAENGIEARVDHRSLEAQGIDREPTSHKGPAVAGMERRGAPTEVGQRIADEVADRLARAQELGRLERAAAQLGNSIIDLSGDLAAAKAEQAIHEKERNEHRTAAFGRIDTACRATSRSSAAAGRAGAFVESDIGCLAQEHRAIEVANGSLGQAIAERRHRGDAGKALGAVGVVLERAHRTLAAAAPVVLLVVEQRAAADRAAAAAKAQAEAQQAAQERARAAAAAKPIITAKESQMEYTQKLEAELQAANARAAAELREKADRLAEQVASGEKSPSVLRTANEHVRKAETLEKIASTPLAPPAPARPASSQAAPARSPEQQALWDARAAKSLAKQQQAAAARDAAAVAPIEPSKQSGAAGPLTLPELVAASFAAMVAWVKERVGPLAQCLAVDGAHDRTYLGSVVEIDELHAVQKTGRNYYVHRLDALDRSPPVGDQGISIEYRGGRGTVTKTPEIEPGKGGQGR